MILLKPIMTSQMNYSNDVPKFAFDSPCFLQTQSGDASGFPAN
ncbi:hypothetical protein P872_12770 [Rhodonellum psychrophilum GCM71 = DSM 17998]|uniref:Uncharacterized protein n=2 Tax=Rhodonellum TaxID=336827 RepID=U5BXJ7_9BACT|nr:hypothetical protein P872_12770 [Rhodonellum psychrophilum GCM71 = DSM 17998]SDZ46060.1 hypothetical protein SAMN05444412_115109 [Rhodonellum ikkaensis]